jgi:phytol kinase
MLDILAIACVLIILGGVIAITKIFGKNLNAEVSRKIIHITMGCAALAFPYVFKSKLSVVILGALAMAFLLFLRSKPGIKTGAGSSLLGIKRKSYGEIYFVISIMSVFILFKEPYEYLISIAVLTFADSAAALVGVSYGRHSLSGEQEASKSGEGSLVFFIVAFICALIPLQLMTQIGRAEVLVISFLVGFLAAMVEAVSENGGDNLLLPLLTYSFIRYNCGKPLEFLVGNFAIMLIFLAVILAVSKIAKFTRLAAAYALLVAYIVMIQGGILWVVPPAATILTVGILPLMNKYEKQFSVPHRVIECNTLVGIFCLYISVFLPRYRELLYLSFSLSFACSLAVSTYHRFLNYITAKPYIAAASGVLKAVVFIAVPTFFITRVSFKTIALYTAFLFISLPFAVFLRKKFDYTKMSAETVRANEILVGLVTLFFTLFAGFTAFAV